MPCLDASYSSDQLGVLSVDSANAPDQERGVADGDERNASAPPSASGCYTFHSF
jgi:hypothetical protein